MKKRIISAIIFGLIFFPAIYFGGIYFLIVSVFCGALATYELMNMFYKKMPALKIMRFIVPAFSVFLILLLYMYENRVDCFYFYFDGNHLALIKDAAMNENLHFMYLGLIAGSFMIFTFIFMLFTVFKKEASAHDLMACLLSITYGGVFFGAAFSIEYFIPISYIGAGSRWGGQVFVYVYGVVCLTDIFAYLIGSKFGRTKLCPHISPKKSVEGAVGGMLVAGIVGTLIAWLCGLMPISKDSGAMQIATIIIAFLLMSFVLSFISQIGDLIASRLKRTYEIKDFGYIMPGHGGILDRFDSFILAGSFMYLFALISKFIFLGLGL